MTFIIKVTLIAAITFNKGSWTWTPWRQGGWNRRTPRKGRALYSATREKGSNQGFYTATRDKGLLVSNTAADNMRAAASPVIRGCLKKLKRITWHGIGMTSKSEIILLRIFKKTPFSIAVKKHLSQRVWNVIAKIALPYFSLMVLLTYLSSGDLN